MKRKNNRGLLVGLLFGLIIAIVIVIVLFANGIISLNKNKDNENLDKENTLETEEKSVEDVIDEKSTKIDVLGTYTKKAENDNGYYSSMVIITNNTDNSIDFSISTAHGIDKEHVNIGEVKGTAKKVAENEYLFEDTIDGSINKISFKFSGDDSNQHLTISEEYPNDINPYGGHGVYFAAEYNKD